MDRHLVKSGGESTTSSDSNNFDDGNSNNKNSNTSSAATASSELLLLEPLNNLNIVSPTNTTINDEENNFFVGYDDEDFAAVLSSLGGGGDDNTTDDVFDVDNNNGQERLDELPEIDIDFVNENGHNDDFFLDSGQLANIFEEVLVANEGLQENLQPRNNNIESDTEELYTELANLKIGGSQKEDDNNNANSSVEPDNTTTYNNYQNIPASSSTDGLPSYLYCQPCLEEEDPFLPLQEFFPSSILEEEEEESHPHYLTDNNINHNNFDSQQEKHTQQGEDELLRLSSLTLNDNSNNDFISKMDVPHSNEKTTTMDEAMPFLSSFGVMESQKQNTTNKQKSRNEDERSCYGHKETIYGITFSECGKYCATASQDSTIKVWDVSKNSLLSTLNGHNKDFECLRVAWASSNWSEDTLDRRSSSSSSSDNDDDDDDLRHLLATSGADGTVKLWSCNNPRDGWTCRSTIDHAELLGRQKKKKKDPTDASSSGSNDTNNGGNEPEEEEEPDVPQIYALQFIDHWRAFTVENEQQTKNSFLMTSSDDYVHLWEATTIHPSTQKIQLIEDDEEEETKIAPDAIALTEVLSIHFGELSHHGFGVTTCNLQQQQQVANSPDDDDDDDAQQPVGKKRKGFGGDRNPNNVIFVFDASYCGPNGLLGAALSDGSLRLVNGRGICISILNLPGCQSHLTSFCWDSTGSRLATTVATGHLITWNLDINGDLQGRGHTVATCTCIMEGGHQVGRPLFGARYCGLTEKCLLSWSVDGSLCLWDSYAQGNINAPIAVLKHDSEYPIYAVEVSKNCIAVGGGSDGGFMGVPLFLYSYSYDKPEESKLEKSGDINMMGNNFDTSSNNEQRDGNVLPSPNEQSKEVMTAKP